MMYGSPDHAKNEIEGLVGQHRWSIAYMSGGSRTASVEHAGSPCELRSPTFPVAAGPEATIINAIYSWRSSAFVPAKLRRWYLRDKMPTSSRPCRGLRA